MTDARLDQLEAEVAAARRRVSDDLEKLRAAAGLSDLTHDVAGQLAGAKDQAIETARSAAAQAVTGVIDDIKERVAANPAAALVIGAGLAWRLYRHPPVTSLLVGAGLLALLRTDPREPSAGAEALRKARGRVERARAGLQDWASERPSPPRLHPERTRSGAVSEDVEAGAWAGDPGAANVPQLELGPRFEGRRRTEPRDKVLLGAAALAIAAAGALAYRRRM